MLMDLKVTAKKQNIPYTRQNNIEPMAVGKTRGLFKRIFVRGQGGLVIRNFKEIDAESFGQRPGLVHRDLKEVIILVDVDTKEGVADQSPKPRVKVIDFRKPVFVHRNEVERWNHGYKLHWLLMAFPKNKQDHTPLPPLDLRAEDDYWLGVLIWRIFSGKSPWDGTIEDDLKPIQYLVSNGAQIKFQLKREVVSPVSRQLLPRCLTAQVETL
ncbi:hypothetical protein BGZ72_001204 [Mortierella alpina]|nr:hypothetical protein BGZ72_001204 [Mortierella alpina]